MEISGYEELFYIPDSFDPIHLQRADDPDHKLGVVISEEDTNQENIELVHNVCQAAGFDPEKQVSIMVLKGSRQLSINDLFAVHPGHPILSFGLHESILNTQFHKNPYQWIRLGEQSILFAHPLSELAGNNTLKRSLWNALQDEFKP